VSARGHTTTREIAARLRRLAWLVPLLALIELGAGAWQRVVPRGATSTSPAPAVR
jgi:hypothetical protein